MKSEKGAITLFILLSILFFIIVAAFLYTQVSYKSVGQEQETRKIIEEYQKETDLDGMEKKYEEVVEEEKSRVIIEFYNPNGEIYDLNEWTNQDLRLSIIYPEDVSDNQKYFFQDGVKIKYTGNNIITENCEIEVIYKNKKTNKIISKIDKNMPTINIINNGGKFGILNNEQTVSIKTEIEIFDKESGIEKAEYAWSNSNAEEPKNGWNSAIDKNEIQKADSGVGLYYLWIKAIDKAGNSITKVSNLFEVYLIDNIKPVIKFETNGNTNWLKAQSTKVIVIDEGGSNLNTSSLKYLWTQSTSQPPENSIVNGFTNNDVISKSDGTGDDWYLWVIAKDYGGNTTIARSNAFYLDNTLPSAVDIDYMGGDNTCSWKNNYNLSLSASDAHSGLERYEMDTNADGVVDLTVSNNFIPQNNFHSHNTRFRTVDKAGNIGPWSDEQHIHMDTQAPSKTTVNLNGYASGSWTSGNVTQTATATDNVGVQKYQYSHDNKNWFDFTNPWTISWDGYWNFYVRAIDYAGNIGPSCDPYTINRTVYKIQNSSSVTYKCSLKDAIDASNAGATIYLLKNFTDSSVGNVNKNLTFNTNGKTLTRTAQIAVLAGCTLNLNGTGTIYSNSGIWLINNAGTVNITAGTISAGGSGQYAVVNSGKAVIQNATIKAANSYSAIHSSNSLEIKSGTFTNTGRYNENVSTTLSGAVLYNSGTAVISGGTFTKQSTGRVIYNSSILTINNINLTADTKGNGAGILNTKTLNIKGGTYKTLDRVLLSNSGNMNVFAGTFTTTAGHGSGQAIVNSGKTKISGGTFKSTNAGLGSLISNNGLIRIADATVTSNTSTATITNETTKKWGTDVCTEECSLHITGAAKISNTGSGVAIRQTNTSKSGGVHTPKSFTGYVYANKEYVIDNNSGNAFATFNGGKFYSPGAKYSNGKVKFGSGATKVKGRP